MLGLAFALCRWTRTGRLLCEIAAKKLHRRFTVPLLRAGHFELTEAKYGRSGLNWISNIWIALSVASLVAQGRILPAKQIKKEKRNPESGLPFVLGRHDSFDAKIYLGLAPVVRHVDHDTEHDVQCGESSLTLPVHL